MILVENQMRAFKFLILLFLRLMVPSGSTQVQVRGSDLWNLNRTISRLNRDNAGGYKCGHLCVSIESSVRKMSQFYS